MKLVKILACALVFCCFVATRPVTPQQLATAEQQKEIKEVLEKIQKAEKAGDNDEVKKLKKQAIELVDKYYKIPSDKTDGEPEYDPSVKGDGKSSKSGKKAKVKLGEATFTTPGWLASTKLHEMVGHGGQAAGDRWYNDAKGDAINEVEAYDLEIKNAEKTGLSKAEIDELKKRRKEYYDTLSDANKKKVDGGDYKMAFLPPSPRSIRTLEGKAQVFVAGNVLTDEMVPVCVRGPQSIEGLVVTAEVDGKKVESRTDPQGRTTIDFAEIAANLTTVATAIVRVVDRSGNKISEATTNVTPGRTGYPARPQISQLPQHVRTGDVVTIPGEHLGGEARLVVGDKIQETLTASSRELTAFIDAPTTGAQPVFVLTPHGESESQTVHFYSFSVRLGKSTITRGERIVATAQYAGLPQGCEIVFTNATPSIVKMTASGAAQNSGVTSTVKISKPDGTINVELVGQSAGAFVVNYEIHFR